MINIEKLNYKLARIFYKNLSPYHENKFLNKILSKNNVDIAAEELVNIDLISDATNSIQLMAPLEIADQTVSDKEYFCVLSWGACGSVWLGNIFNNHPEVTCSVGNGHPITSLSYDDNKEVINKLIEEIKSPSDVKYGASSYLDGHLIPEINPENYYKYMSPVSYGAGNLIKHSIAKRGITFEIPERMNMADNFPFSFHELREMFPNSSVYGNVHGMTCAQIAPLVKSNHPFLKNIVFVDLIRHPITRLESIINGRKLLYKCDNFERRAIEKSIIDNIKEIDRLTKKFKVNFDDIENKIRFYCNYSILGSGWNKLCVDDIKSLKVKRILFERIKAEPEYLSWFFSYLTKGRLSLSKNQLSEIYDTDFFDNIGRMGVEKIAFKTARTQWEEWPEWQREVFTNQCNEYDMREVYSEFGYDLSFVK